MDNKIIKADKIFRENIVKFAFFKIKECTWISRTKIIFEETIFAYYKLTVTPISKNAFISKIKLEKKYFWT